MEATLILNKTVTSKSIRNTKTSNFSIKNFFEKSYDRISKALFEDKYVSPFRM